MDKQIAQLEDVLRRQIAANERLLSHMMQKVDAFRRADQPRMAACCQAENQEVQLIGELEKQRLTLVAELTKRIDPSAAQPLVMGELAQRLDEPARGRLLVLRQELRSRIEAVRREGGVARRAAEVLLRHMQGVVHTIGGAITGIHTYGKRGTPTAAALAVSTFSATA